MGSSLRRRTGEKTKFCWNCTARQCSPIRRKIMGCPIINPAVLLLMKHLVIGQRQKAPNFLGFSLVTSRSLASIGRHFATTSVVHLSKRTEASLITESDRCGPNHRIRPGCAGRAFTQEPRVSVPIGVQS